MSSALSSLYRLDLSSICSLCWSAQSFCFCLIVSLFLSFQILACSLICSLLFSLYAFSSSLFDSYRSRLCSLIFSLLSSLHSFFILPSILLLMHSFSLSHCPSRAFYSSLLLQGYNSNNSILQFSSPNSSNNNDNENLYLHFPSLLLLYDERCFVIR